MTDVLSKTPKPPRGSGPMFPERKRCLACRGALGRNHRDPVLLGRYCSSACAQMAALPRSPDEVPRNSGCTTVREGKTVFKVRYRTAGEVRPEHLRESTTRLYWCEGVCGHLHMGHTRVRDDEEFRIWRKFDDISDTLVKLRGKASRTEVAKVAGVRPIRLKELEEGAAHPENLATLMKVLTVLQAGLGVSIKKR